MTSHHLLIKGDGSHQLSHRDVVLIPADQNASFHAPEKLHCQLIESSGLLSQLNELHLHVPLPSSSSSSTMDLNADLASTTKEPANVTVDNYIDIANRYNRTKTLSDSIKQQVSSEKPFHRWLKSLRRRAIQKGTARARCTDIVTIETCQSSAMRAAHSIHGYSSSESSFAFVSKVHSADVSMLSINATTKAVITKARSERPIRTDQGTNTSISDSKMSQDSDDSKQPLLVDLAVEYRSEQRRRIIEELIKTEEAYIRDVRFLSNIYATLFTARPTLCENLRPAINANLTDIIELHDDILRELHVIVANSRNIAPNYKDEENTAEQNVPPFSGIQYGLPQSQVVVTSSAVMTKIKKRPLENSSDKMTDPQVAREVARIFGQKMRRFFLYEEYGARYENIVQEMATIYESLEPWDASQRNLETLASTLGSVNSYIDSPKKSLTIRDLVIKPIQRICRYPLLFSELLKHTPVVDCPNSNVEIGRTLKRLREATMTVNRATDDIEMKHVWQKTSLLQDRLFFSNDVVHHTSKGRVRAFGHILMCGVLYICWHTPPGVRGEYMICLLYRDVLCLASAPAADLIYNIRACINMHGTKVGDVNNSGELQAHSVPFSWKLIFESENELHEIIMMGRNAKEEEEWRVRLSDPGYLETKDGKFDVFSYLDLDIESIGVSFGKHGSLLTSPHIPTPKYKASSIDPMMHPKQIVLKNTSTTFNTSGNSFEPTQLSRSQSVISSRCHVPILAPPRNERARLEAVLIDVWTRDILPFPGTTKRSRSEQLVRTSASSVMRKLSVTSIASSLSKRSGSTKQRPKSMGYDESKSARITDGKISTLSSEQSAIAPSEIDGCRLTKRPRIDSSPTSSREDVLSPTATDKPAGVTNVEEIDTAPRFKNISNPTRSWSCGRKGFKISKRNRSISITTDETEINAENWKSNSFYEGINFEGRRTASIHSLRAMFR